MKIAVIGTLGIPATYGGVERHVDELYTRLAARGHEPTVYCRAFYTKEEGYYRGIRLRRLPSLRTKHLETFSHTLLATFMALREGFDVFHYHAMGPGLFSVIPKSIGIRTVVTFHGLDWQRDKWGTMARLVLKGGEQTALRFADSTIVVSRTMLEYYRKTFRRDLFYIPNGVTIQQIRQPSLIHKLGLEPGKYILFASKLSPEKGCHALIRAFCGLKTDMKLVIAGGSRHSDAYIESLKAEANDSVLFPGFVVGELLAELFSNAYLFVQPSTIEGLAISVLEAMSYGRYVLCSDILENKEAIGEAGGTFRVSDVYDLRAKLEWLIQNPDLVREIGVRGRARVSVEYDWDRVAVATEGVLMGAPKANGSHSGVAQHG